MAYYIPPLVNLTTLPSQISTSPNTITNESSRLVGGLLPPSTLESALPNLNLAQQVIPNLHFAPTAQNYHQRVITTRSWLLTSLHPRICPPKSQARPTSHPKPLLSSDRPKQPPSHHDSLALGMFFVSYILHVNPLTITHIASYHHRYLLIFTCSSSPCGHHHPLSTQLNQDDDVTRMLSLLYVYMH